MGSYQEALAGLNQAQRTAVTTIDGPVLVIAGPGTGKTQLLTTRIAHILSTTDTLPENILCLTFTDSAAHNMRERLSSMIGQAAYKVTMSTYHAFGSDLIRRFPDYFAEQGELQPIDDLGIDTFFRQIIADLPYGNPLKYADMYLRDIQSFVSDAKRALLTPKDIRDVASANDAFLESVQQIIADSLQDMKRIDKSALDRFKRIAQQVEDLPATAITPEGIVPLETLFMQELGVALATAEETGKTTSLTTWKNAWLAKDAHGRFIVDGARTSQKLRAIADVYETYLTRLNTEHLFDYDDMILRAVSTLTSNDDLRFTLQEQYQYILLDEFQDTNGAQLKLVELLTDNPVHEGRPNVLAVGDDDQAIYAFQGADYSHMLQFQRMYRDVLLVPLTQNYRSHADVLHTARGIAEQIEERLHHHFPQIEKTLVASNPKLPQTARIERYEAKSDMAQFAWTAQRIKALIDSGTPADEIAVLAPQHKYLEPLVPFLQEAGVPVRYDKRENVLDDQAITQLLRMAELCLALAAGNFTTANALWCEVLSFPFWNVPTSVIWQLSWQAADDDQNWTETLLQHETLKPIALFFMRLSMEAPSETLETMLDYLIGVAPLDVQEPDHAPFTSPYYSHYFTEKHEQAVEHIGSFWELLTNLTVLRARLREYRRDQDSHLTLSDFIGFVEAHRAAEIKILNTSPYQDADQAVQLMTAFKAKGMEFASVFILAVNNEAWGKSARSQGSRLSLPQNLLFMRYAGATNDERLRLFYVALTRAKTELYLVSYTANFTGKIMNRLQYLEEEGDGQQVVSPLLPKQGQIVHAIDSDATGLITPTTELATYWHHRHQAALSKEDIKALLRHRLQQFQLSPTHVNAFTDLEYGGPAPFFMNTILRFPKAPTANGQFGNAMHETLEWLHIQHKNLGAMPSLDAVHKIFEQRLRSKRLSVQDTTQMLDRGRQALQVYFAKRLHTVSASNECEYNFRREGVFIGKAHMAGKIDKLIIDREQKTIEIVDYKTGKGFTRWEHTMKLHKYRQQLYMYRALVEGSQKFAGYRVTGAYLEFIEPDDNGDIHELHLVFNDQEYQYVKQLAEKVWEHVQKVSLPEVGEFSSDLKGTEAFEQALLDDIL